METSFWQRLGNTGLLTFLGIVILILTAGGLAVLTSPKGRALFSSETETQKITAYPETEGHWFYSGMMAGCLTWAEPGFGVPPEEVQNVCVALLNQAIVEGHYQSVYDFGEGEPLYQGPVTPEEFIDYLESLERQADS